MPTVANGKPAFGQYRRSTTGDGHDPWALQILDIVDGELVELSFFLDTEHPVPAVRPAAPPGRPEPHWFRIGGSRGLPMPAATDTQNQGADARRPANGNGDGPRRSSLVQERSRRTRQELVNAAVKLWTERGFEHGVENTTVEEIARAAGVTKGTFYFHFAHKEDVLLEMSLTTSDAVTARRRPSSAEQRRDRSTRSCSRRSPRWRGAPSACPAPRSPARSGSSTSTPTRPRAEHDAAGVARASLEAAQARGELPARRRPRGHQRHDERAHDHRGRGMGARRYTKLAPELAYRMRVLLAGDPRRARV